MSDFALYFDQGLSVPTPCNGRNDYFQKAKDRMDRSFRQVERYVVGGAILDIGASPFYLLDRALKNGAKRAEGIYFANDTHPLRELNHIYSANGAIGIHHLDVEKGRLPFEDNSFEVVSACEILEHLEYFPSHFGDEVRRVLKPGGKLLITVPNVGSIGNILKLVAGRNIFMKYRSDATGRHKHEYTAAQLRALAEHFGLEVTSQGYFPSPTSHLKWLRPIYQVMAKVPIVRRYSPVLWLVARMPDTKPTSLGPRPSILYSDDRSIED